MIAERCLVATCALNGRGRFQRQTEADFVALILAVRTLTGGALVAAVGFQVADDPAVFGLLELEEQVGAAD